MNSREVQDICTADQLVSIRVESKRSELKRSSWSLGLERLNISGELKLKSFELKRTVQMKS